MKNVDRFKFSIAAVFCQASRKTE